MLPDFSKLTIPTYAYWLAAALVVLTVVVVVRYKFSSTEEPNKDATKKPDEKEASQEHQEETQTKQVPNGADSPQQLANDTEPHDDMTSTHAPY